MLYFSQTYSQTDAINNRPKIDYNKQTLWPIFFDLAVGLDFGVGFTMVWRCGCSVCSNNKSLAWHIHTFFSNSCMHIPILKSIYVPPCVPPPKQNRAILMAKFCRFSGGFGVSFMTVWLWYYCLRNKLVKWNLHVKTTQVKQEKWSLWENGSPNTRFSAESV